jgi:hypothetical protein
VTLSRRDRAVVLGLAGLATAWRWLLAVLAPLPGLDSARALAASERLAAGELAALADAGWQAPFAVLLAPGVALGAPSWWLARVLACLAAGGAVVGLAMVAARLRAPAAVPTAVLATVAAGSTAAAAGASHGCLGLAAVAVGWWSWVAGRRGLGVVLCVVALAVPGDQLRPDVAPSAALRLLLGTPFVLALLVWWWPGTRPLRRGLVLLLVGTIAALTLLPQWVLPPLGGVAAVLAGVALAGLPKRWLEGLLCLVVLVECHAGWQQLEPRDRAVERWLGRYLRRGLLAGDELVTDLPRVAWAAGLPPRRFATADAVLAGAAGPRVQVVVLGPALAGDSTLRAQLAGRFVTHELTVDLAALAAGQGITTRIRRR